MLTRAALPFLKKVFATKCRAVLVGLARNNFKNIILLNGIWPGCKGTAVEAAVPAANRVPPGGTPAALVVVDALACHCQRS